MKSEPHPESPASMLSVEQWRPEVIAFASLMEQQLRENDHKPGWKSDEPEALFRRLVEESSELEDAIYHTVDGEAFVAKEAADVANFAMMIADVCGALPRHHSLSRSAGGEGETIDAPERREAALPVTVEQERIVRVALWNALRARGTPDDICYGIINTTIDAVWDLSKSPPQPAALTPKAPGGELLALQAQEDAEDAREECPECEGEGQWEHCGACSLKFGRAIDLRRAVLAGNMAAFGASDAACYLYPDANQEVERAAFCHGAEYGAPKAPGEMREEVARTAYKVSSDMDVEQGFDALPPWEHASEIHRNGMLRVADAILNLLPVSPGVGVAPSAPGAEDVREALELREAALMDCQYIAGVQAGWNAAQSDDAEAKLAALHKSREGRIAALREARQSLADRAQGEGEKA